MKEIKENRGTASPTEEAQLASTALPSELPIEIGAIMRNQSQSATGRGSRGQPRSRIALRAAMAAASARGLTAPLSGSTEDVGTRASRRINPPPGDRTKGGAKKSAIPGKIVH
jgi:hypothetical protein